VWNEGEVGRRSQSVASGVVGFFNHLRDGPEGLAGVTGTGTSPVGAGWGPLRGARASFGRRGLGVKGRRSGLQGPRE